MPHPVFHPAQLTAQLKALRKARGFTQAELGARLGVGQVRIAEIEKDPGAISVDQLMRMLAALDARLFVDDVREHDHAVHGEAVGRVPGRPSAAPLPPAAASTSKQSPLSQLRRKKPGRW